MESGRGHDTHGYSAEGSPRPTVASRARATVGTFQGLSRNAALRIAARVQVVRNVITRPLENVLGRLDRTYPKAGRATRIGLGVAGSVARDRLKSKAADWVMRH